MKAIVLFITAAFILQSIKAQNSNPEDTAKIRQNSYYVEFAGAALLGISLNYERFLSRQPGGFSVKGGLGIGFTLDIFGPDKYYLVIPLGVSYNIPFTKNKRSFLEIGADYSIITATTENNTRVTAAITGWRYQSKTGDFQLRATYLLLLYSSADDSHSNLAPWFGVSVGQRF